MVALATDRTVARGRGSGVDVAQQARDKGGDGALSRKQGVGGAGHAAFVPESGRAAALDNAGRMSALPEGMSCCSSVAFAFLIRLDLYSRYIHACFYLSSGFLFMTSLLL